MSILLASTSEGVRTSPTIPVRGEQPRVAAVIVIYCLTDPQLLRRLLEGTVNQVTSTFVVDNTPASNIKGSPIPVAYQDRVCYVPLGDNMGIAAAQNAGIQKAMESRHTHVLLLDHDSALPAGMVSGLLLAEASLCARGEKVAAVGPVFVDEKTGEYSPAVRHRYLRVKKIPVDLQSNSPIEADYIIASGTLVSIRVLLEVGPLKNELFLDWVDIEWGLRARHYGYRCFICPQAVMRHSIGDAAVHVFGKYINIHSDLRTYYLVRNAVFLMRVAHMGWKWRIVTAFKIPQYVIFYSLYSKHPGRCFLLLLRGTFHGLIGKLGRLD